MILVIALRNRVIGYLNAAITQTEAYRKKVIVAEICDMAIEKKYRGQGIGKILFKAFAQWATDRKAKILRVIASPDNDNACGFYSKISFKPISVTFERKL